MSELVWLNPHDTFFPPTTSALEDPNGLLAVGGDLSPARLIAAYKKGIFPWFDDSQPILWWSPDPRMVLLPQNLHLGKTLKKLAKKQAFKITIDTHFSDVMQGCAQPRADQDGTWITTDMENAYLELHKLGYAHSIEAWQDGELVGGLYGIAINRVFYGESMFSKVSGASKIAFANLATQLANWGFYAIDCQVATEYLASFGAAEMPRAEFEQILQQSLQSQPPKCQIEGWQNSWNMPDYGQLF